VRSGGDLQAHRSSFCSGKVFSENLVCDVGIEPETGVVIGGKRPDILAVFEVRDFASVYHAEWMRTGKLRFERVFFGGDTVATQFLIAKTRLCRLKYIIELTRVFGAAYVSRTPDPMVTKDEIRTGHPKRLRLFERRLGHKR
jgi:hypothetical protein